MSSINVETLEKNIYNPFKYCKIEKNIYNPSKYFKIEKNIYNPFKYCKIEKKTSTIPPNIVRLINFSHRNIYFALLRGNYDCKTEL